MKHVFASYKKYINSKNKYYQNVLNKRIEIAMTFQPQVKWCDMTESGHTAPNIKYFKRSNLESTTFKIKKSKK